MEEFDKNSEENIEVQGQEVSISDKILGVITEPAKLFDRLAGLKTKTSDWLLPLAIAIVLGILSQIILMGNPVIKNQVIDKQMTTMEKNFDQMVKDKKITQEQANEQLDQMRDRMNDMNGVASTVIRSVSIIVMSFVIFFIVLTVYFLAAKFLLKGEGDFKSAMTAYGLASYISIIHIAGIIILSLAMSKMVTGLSAATFMNTENMSLGTYILSKLEVFTLWGLFVTATGLAKMFRAKNAAGYYAAIFGIYAVWSLLIYAISKAVPMLGGLAGM